jgi:hypothetical protein
LKRIGTLTLALSRTKGNCRFLKKESILAVTVSLNVILSKRGAPAPSAVEGSTRSDFLLLAEAKSNRYA